MNDRRHYPLTAVSADGWFDKLGESSPSFRQLCDAIGKQFLAYSVIAGVRITAVSIDQRSQDASLVDFMLDDQQEHRLALGEFRRRVAATMLAEEPVPDSLPPAPTPEDLQGFLGGRFVLLAPLFGLGCASCVWAGESLQPCSSTWAARVTRCRSRSSTTWCATECVPRPRRHGRSRRSPST
jgi:hypothetical protein